MAHNSPNLKYERRLKYYYLRFLRLRGEPHELAFGIAIGVFSGMMPILPVQIIFAVALALLFKASKITAALGTWVSNPLNWYFIYVYDFKLGAYLLGVDGGPEIIKAVTDSINRGDPMSVVWGKLFSSGITLVSALLIGGIIIGVVAAVPSYFLFLKIFQKIREWRLKRKADKASLIRQIKKSKDEDNSHS